MTFTRLPGNLYFASPESSVVPTAVATGGATLTGAGATGAAGAGCCGATGATGWCTGICGVSSGACGACGIAGADGVNVGPGVSSFPEVVELLGSPVLEVRPVLLAFAELVAFVVPLELEAFAELEA